MSCVRKHKQVITSRLADDFKMLLLNTAFTSKETTVYPYLSCCFCGSIPQATVHLLALSHLQSLFESLLGSPLMPINISPMYFDTVYSFKATKV